MNIDILQLRQLYVKNKNNVGPTKDFVMTADGSGGTFFAIAKTAPSTLQMIQDVSGRLVDLSENVTDLTLEVATIEGSISGLINVVGDNFMVAGTRGNNFIWYSPSGLSWTSVSLNMSINTIVWNGAIWLVGGTGTSGASPLVYSSDGITWRQTVFTILTTVNAVAWNGSFWLAFGVNSGNSNVIAKSVDGITWTDPTANLNAVLSVPSTASWNGTYWLVGGRNANTGVNNQVATSMNGGITWSSVYSAEGQINTLVYNVASWVAGGNSGVIIKSTNGSAWTAYNPIILASTNISSLAWNGSLWVATGNKTPTEGIIGYSYDGETWSLATYPALVFANSVAWNGTSWFVSGVIGINNALLKSSNGITWSLVTTIVTTPLYALASRRPLPYIADRSLIPQTINTTVSFTIYLDFTSPDSDLISKIYIPPGLLASGVSGTFESPSWPTGLSVGSGIITLTNTTYPALVGMYGQSYNDASGGWSPIANIGGTNPANITYFVGSDSSVIINFVSLDELNGGVYTPKAVGRFNPFLVTFTLTYLNTNI